MDHLEELEKKLYAKDAKEDTLKQRLGKIGLLPDTHAKKTEMNETEAWNEDREKKEYPKGPRNKISFARLSLIFFAIALTAGASYYYSHTGFDESLVTLEVRGPKTFIAGDKIKITVSYKNKTSVNLKNAHLTLAWPENTILEEGTPGGTVSKKDLSLVPPEREASVEFEGRIFGSENDIKNFEATFVYTPETVSSEIEIINQFQAKISGTPLSLKINTPSLIVSEKEFEIGVDYLNSADIPFADLILRLEYPINFQFLSSDPAPKRSNNEWVVGNLSSKSSQTIKMKGKLTSGQQTNIQFKASLGIEKNGNFITYASLQKSVDLSTSVLIIFSQLNSSRDYIASSGDTLNYKIRYKNTSSVPIGNIVISGALGGKAIDPATINVEWGSYDEKTSTIIWNASGVPSLGLLGPQGEGEVNFSVRVRKPLPIFNFSDKNFVVSLKSRIDSNLVPGTLAGTPIGMEEILETKIKTNASIRLAGVYKDSVFSNSGPIPPRVGARTTYTVSFQITNNANDLEQVSLETFFPPYVEWLNNVSPPGQTITYVPQTGKLTLMIPKISAGTSILTPAWSLAFQIALTPAQNQVGDRPLLVNRVIMKAKDSFTGLDMEYESNELSTDLRNDPFVGESGGRVTQ